MRTALPASQADQHLKRAGRSKARHQGSRRGHLARQLHALRSRILRPGAENPATSRQPVRHDVVTHVLGTTCHLCVRARHTADGPPQRIRDKGQQHLPGDEAWLIGEHRVSGEKKYYLANLPAGMDLRSLAATIKARWICEQAHQQLKEELGLDHFEGRSWHGLHRHALMTMIAYAFLQHRRLTKVRREKKNQRPATSTDVAGRPTRHRRSHHAIKPSAMSVLPSLDRRATAA